MFEKEARTFHGESSHLCPPFTVRALLVQMKGREEKNLKLIFLRKSSMPKALLGDDLLGISASHKMIQDITAPPYFK